jgi:hypothetical protein
MENHHFYWKNNGNTSFLMEKRWKIIIFNGKIVDKHHCFWKKRWEIIMFNGKTVENHHC